MKEVIGSPIIGGFSLNNKSYVDERQGLAETLADLKNWEMLVPEGFEVFCLGDWYTYDSSHNSAETGHFKVRSGGAVVDPQNPNTALVTAINEADKTANIKNLSGVIYYPETKTKVVKDKNNKDLQSVLDSIETNKVSVVAGKGLSSNDFTQAYIDKINALDEKLFPLELYCSLSKTVFEKGTTNSVLLTVRVTQKSVNVTNACTIKLNNAVIPIVGDTYPISNITDTLVCDVSVTYQSKVLSKQLTVSYVYPFYSGVVADNWTVSGTAIKALTKTVEAKGNKKKVYNLDNQKSVFAYPASYGTLSKILDVNQFNYVDSYDVTTTQIDGIDYKVYKLRTKIQMDGFEQTFMF